MPVNLSFALRVAAVVTLAMHVASLTPALAQSSAPSALDALRMRWNQPQAPFKIHGDTYYVGTRGLSAILIASPQGHVLIDAALPESAKLIADNIRALKFRVEDIKLILNSHVHFDHAGGLAELQRLSGADVVASESSAKVLRTGAVGSDDPQYGSIPPIEAVANVKSFKATDVLRVGSIALTPHLTPGHTPGGTTWTWPSCERDKCIAIVYADSLNPISAPGYLFSGHVHQPNGQQQLEHSFAAIKALSCDILLAPHPELVDLFGKLDKRTQAKTNIFVDDAACGAYVDSHREKLNKRLAEERKSAH
jgi:metallo-beta-lactamase class B